MPVQHLAQPSKSSRNGSLVDVTEYILEMSQGREMGSRPSSSWSFRDKDPVIVEEVDED